MRRTRTPNRLDRDTPKWPEVRITLGEHPTVTVSGVITPVDGEGTAITRCAAQARTLGRPIRARVTTADGALRRLIVTPDAAVTGLDPPATTPAVAAAPTRLAKQPARRRGSGVLARFPARIRPLIRWGAPIMAVLVLVSVVAMAVHGPGSTADATAPVTAPLPPAGRLYTEHPPPGWSPDAAWVIQLAKDAPEPVVAADGTIAAVTDQDHSATPATGDDRYLSILEPDGRTRWAVPLDTAPRTGPLLLPVDGTQVVAVAGTRDLTYWPLTGGPETVLALPSGARITPTGLVTLPGNRLGYLHGGALRVIDGLPRTTPRIALDGAAVVTQDDNGAWWTLTADAAPKGTTPRKPPNATAFRDVLAVGEEQVLLAWTTPDPRTAIVTAHDRSTGALTGTVTAPASALPRHGTYLAAGTLAGTGPVIRTGATLSVLPGLTVTRVADQIYGTLHGDPVVVHPNGETTPLLPGTLQPIGQTHHKALVIGATNKLYVLERDGEGRGSGG